MINEATLRFFMSYLIVHNQKECVGCGVCASVCSEFFKMTRGGDKAILINSKKNINGDFELAVSDVSCAQEASEMCAFGLIKIEKID